MDAYLIEARSISGISGSPVFVRKTLTIDVREEGQPEKPVRLCGLSDEFRCLGMVFGHWDINESKLNEPRIVQDKRGGVNMGVAIISPAYKVLETLMHPGLVDMRKQQEWSFWKDLLPTPDKRG